MSLCPLADEPLVALLNKRNYRVEHFMHTWYWQAICDRRLQPEESYPPPPAGVVVRPISPDEAELWVQTSYRGFAGDSAVVPADSIVAAYPHMAHASCWLAWLDDQPAGAGALAIHDGAAELFGTSTRPSCDGRGVQAALMHARMAAAASAGCDLIAVHTDPGSASQRNVERAGFRLAYTKVTMRNSDL